MNGPDRGNGLEDFPADLAERFEVETLLGRGGMSTVWGARRRADGLAVALKVMAGDFASDPVFRHRFRLEAKLEGQELHPALVRIHEAGEKGDCFWIAMERIEGRSLREEIDEKRPFPVASCLVLGAEIADCLGALHRARYVHRDLKAENVMVQPDGRPRLLDLGLARQLGEAGPTQTGFILGTPFYISPEVCRGEKASPASDVFALGLLLWECLSPRDFFAGDRDHPGRLLARRAGGDGEPPVPPGLTPDVLALLRCLVADDPRSRPSNGTAAAHAIRLILEGRGGSGGEATRVTGEGPWMGTGRFTRGGGTRGGSRTSTVERAAGGGTGEPASGGVPRQAGGQRTVELAPGASDDGDGYRDMRTRRGRPTRPLRPLRGGATRPLAALRGEGDPGPDGGRGRRGLPIAPILAAVLVGAALALALVTGLPRRAASVRPPDTASRRPGGDGTERSTGGGLAPSESSTGGGLAPSERSTGGRLAPSKRSRADFEGVFRDFLAERRRQASTPVLRAARDVGTGVAAAVAFDALKADWILYRGHGLSRPREEKTILDAMSRSAAIFDFLRRVPGVETLPFEGEEGLGWVTAELVLGLRIAEDGWAARLKDRLVKERGLFRASSHPYVLRMVNEATRPHTHDLAESLCRSRERALRRQAMGDGPPQIAVLDLVFANAVRHSRLHAGQAEGWVTPVIASLAAVEKPDGPTLYRLLYGLNVQAHCASVRDEDERVGEIVGRGKRIILERLRGRGEGEACPNFHRLFEDLLWVEVNGMLDLQDTPERRRRGIERIMEHVAPRSELGPAMRRCIFRRALGSSRVMGDDRRRVIASGGDLAAEFTAEQLAGPED